MSKLRRAVILDRDGTLIVDKIYLNDPDAIEYLPGVETALNLLQDAGFLLIGATNQSGVPRGLVSLENLHEIHRRIESHFSQAGVRFERFYYAPYMTDSDHPMRKPNPGMLLAAQKDFNLDLSASWMVGDRMTDVAAGHRAGCSSALIGQTESPEGSTFAPPEVWAKDLLEAAREILKRHRSDRRLKKTQF